MAEEMTVKQQTAYNLYIVTRRDVVAHAAFWNAACADLRNEREGYDLTLEEAEAELEHCEKLLGSLDEWLEAQVS